MAGNDDRQRVGAQRVAGGARAARAAGLGWPPACRSTPSRRGSRPWRRRTRRPKPVGQPPVERESKRARRPAKYSSSSRRARRAGAGRRAPGGRAALPDLPAPRPPRHRRGRRAAPARGRAGQQQVPDRRVERRVGDVEQPGLGRGAGQVRQRMFVRLEQRARAGGARAGLGSVIAELLSQSFEALVDVAPRGLLAGAHHRRDLRVAGVGDVAQGHGRALLGRELAHARPELLVAARGRRCRRRLARARSSTGTAPGARARTGRSPCGGRRSGSSSRRLEASRNRG